ncbi:MAG: HAMP domain-containing histidine kinase [Kiritimatiellae bacterium]|nr:HAMP domain-containing histidine kinase [Kiritimatiellia bacterium]
MKLDDSDLRRLNKVLRHRLRNFASGIQNAVKLLSSELDERLSPQEREYFPLILNECRQVGVLTDRLNLLFEDVPPGHKAGLGDIVAAEVSRLHGEFPTASFRVELTPEAEAAILSTSQHVETALGEILVNAVEANPAGTVHLSGDASAEALHVQVADSGQGVPPEELEKIFLPFYTTRARHIGIGLSIAKRLVSGLGGALQAACGADAGLRLEMTIPCTAAGEIATDQAVYGLSAEGMKQA